MQVTVYERCKLNTVHKGVKKIEKQTFHLFITVADGSVYTYELEDVERIEVSL
jgi:hypothetical protein